jgi:hypothetical protein
VWRHLKHHNLGRQTLADAVDLHEKVLSCLHRLQKLPSVIRGFFAESSQLSPLGGGRQGDRVALELIGVLIDGPDGSRVATVLRDNSTSRQDEPTWHRLNKPMKLWRALHGLSYSLLLNGHPAWAR